MGWNLTLLLVHLLWLGMLVALVRHCPDQLQRLVVALLASSFLVLVWISLADLLPHVFSPPRWLRHASREVEHIAVLFYVFRLFVADQERRCLRIFSTPLHP